MFNQRTTNIFTNSSLISNENVSFNFEENDRQIKNKLNRFDNANGFKINKYFGLLADEYKPMRQHKMANKSTQTENNRDNEKNLMILQIKHISHEISSFVSSGTLNTDGTTTLRKLHNAMLIINNEFIKKFKSLPEITHLQQQHKHKHQRHSHALSIPKSQPQCSSLESMSRTKKLKSQMEFTFQSIPSSVASDQPATFELSPPQLFSTNGKPPLKRNAKSKWQQFINPNDFDIEIARNNKKSIASISRNFHYER